MKPEKVIEEMLEQYKFDYEMTQNYNETEDKDKELIRLEGIIDALSWVLREE